MALSEKKFCVFCGEVPTSKTREHVVPYWLLELTGDPKRVVTMGINYAKNKAPMNYSWSQFVAPACDSCNQKYSDLEGRIKAIAIALEKRQELAVADYIELLDWLDKVRIGVWLTRHLIENHPIGISPNFHISSRIGQKDRMVAVYSFDGDSKGINLFGNDSLISSSMPSCFGLRFNNTLLLNASTDFLCSKGCGFPYPEKLILLKGGPNDGMMRLDDFRYQKTVSHPITDLKLYKPVVWLYQPIKQPTDDPHFQDGFVGHYNVIDTRIASRTIGGTGRMGALFRQFSDRVEILTNPKDKIAFDEVTGKDTATAGDIAASVYEAQIAMFESVEEECVEPKQLNSFEKIFRKLKLSSTREFAQKYRSRSDPKKGFID